MKKVTRITTRKVIQPIPKGDPEEPWGSVLRSIWSPFITRENSLSADFGINVLEWQWAADIGYVYSKKWNPRYKHSKVKATQLRGDVLWSLLELCIQVHAVHPLAWKNYQNASIWFDHICWERKTLERQQLFHSGGIKSILASERKIIDHYRCFENPHPEESEIHQQRLVNTIIEIHESKKFSNIVNKYWKGLERNNNKSKSNYLGESPGLIRALSSVCTYYDRQPEDTILFENGQLFIQEGKGKNRVLVPEDCIKRFLQNA